MSAGYIYSESDTAVTGSSQPAQTSRRQIFISNSLWFIAAGQIERVVGILLSFSLRWGLSLADIGVYSGLRLLLDNTSYSSLGVALGAVQKRPVLFASGNPAEAERLTNVAAGTNSITSGIYASALIIWGLYLTLFGKIQWGIGLICVGLMVVLKRRQDFQIAIMRSDGRFFSTSRIAIQVNFAFSIFMIAGILLFGFWGMLLGLFFGFVWQGILLAKADDSVFLQDTFDFRTACHLALTGLPILAMNSSWMLMGSLDRVLILGVMPDGETQAGYYSIAILATSWCQDVAGRISLVLYPEYQKNVGKGIDRGIILKQAEYGTMMLLGALMAVSLWIMPFCYYIIPQIFPRLSPGLAAFLTMLPGSIFFAAAWPIRQALIATGNSWAGTVVALIILIPQFLVLKSVCATRSISEVAMISSLFQML
ncbi:MAG: lipopolysaccharide biosynthesis protein, partial [bacterium]